MKKAKKSFIGIVVSDKMEKTAVVKVEKFGTDPFYKKRIKISKRYKADNQIGAKENDKVVIVETRPLSKEKRWRVAEIIGKKLKEQKAIKEEK